MSSFELTISRYSTMKFGASQADSLSVLKNHI